MVHYFNVSRWVCGRCIGGHWLENPLPDDAKAGSTQKSWQTRKKVGLKVWRLKDDLLIHQPDRFQQKVAQYKHNGYHDHAIKITVHDVWRNNCLLLQKSCDLKKNLTEFNCRSRWSFCTNSRVLKRVDGLCP